MCQASSISVYSRREFLISAGMGAAGLWLAGCERTTASPLIQINHVPNSFARRYGHFTANICGVVAKEAARTRYRLNDSEWLELKHMWPRVPPPYFTIELSAQQLLQGLNRLEIETITIGNKPELTSLQLLYDPSPIKMPALIDWSKAPLDVQDGHWEVFSREGDWRVRPKPGTENYDRVIVVAGAFAGGRRIETDLIFRKNTGSPYGFGVLPLWGGRPDESHVSPRRGWNFSLSWYYSYYNAVGSEFSYKYGDNPGKWISSYRSFDLKSDVKYHVTIECWPEIDAQGKHLRYRQKMRWQEEGTKALQDWIDLTDTEGSPLPEGEYGVALVAHRSKVEFGSVRVEPLTHS